MNKKTLLTLSLSAILALNSFPVFAMENISLENMKVQDAKGKAAKGTIMMKEKIVTGDSDGNFRISKKVTRAEFAKMIVAASGLEEEAKELQNVQSKFEDVKVEHWANGIINLISESSVKGNGQKIISGYDDNTFRPDENITYNEMAKMLVVLSKTDLTEDEIKNANENWPIVWASYANDLNIFEDIDAKSFNDKVSRIDSFTMLYNALEKEEYKEEIETSDEENEEVEVIEENSDEKISVPIK